MQKPGFLFCVCPDSKILKDEIEKRANAYFSSYQKLVFYGDEELPDAFWSELLLQNLFASQKIIILRRANEISADTLRRLSSALAKQNSAVLLFICLEVNFDKNQPKIPAHLKKMPFFIHAQTKGWIWEDGGITANNIRKYLANKSSEYGLKFSSDAMMLMLELMPHDAQVIDSELAKLALYVQGEVQTSDLSGITSSQEFDIFAFINDLQHGRTKNIWNKIFKSDNSAEDIIFPLLALMQREVRILWQLKSGEKPSVFVYNPEEKRKLALKLGYTGLSNMLDACYKAECNIKYGLFSVAQSLDILISDFSKIFVKF